MSTKSTNGTSRALVHALNAAVGDLGGFAQSTFEGRHCSRCGRPLTDPASRQLGIGPVCNMLTTKLAASSSIPASYPLAILTGYRLKATTECGIERQRDGAKLAGLVLAVSNAIVDLVFENAAFAASVDGYEKCADHDQAIGSDNRLIIKAVDTILSFKGLDRDFRLALIRLVKELGYVGVAGVMAGHGSTGPSKLTFNKLSGVLTLTGSKNKPGLSALLAAIRDGKFTTYPIFTFSGKGQGALKMVEIALEYWPMLDESVEVAVLTSQIKEWIAANTVAIIPKPPASTAPVSNPSAPYVSLRVIDTGNVGVTIQNFDWKGGKCTGLVSKIKADIAPKLRKYDGDRREWRITMGHEEALRTVGAFAAQFGLEMMAVQ